jgi:hypothetical protein
LSRLRSSLSHHPLSADIEAILPGVVMVKLFNLVCAELGPRFLGPGAVRRIAAILILDFAVENFPISLENKANFDTLGRKRP